MSVYASLMKTARMVKRKAVSMRAKPVYLSPVRRVGHVAVKQRICAMTFDDGPMLLPPSERPGGDPLTLELIRSLEEFSAFGTFDIVGDTSGNYPDKPGREGTASWGGIKYDHYPDINCDEKGGAVHCGELIGRILSGGHALSNHGYFHILFGRKSLVYSKRAFHRDVGAVIDDLSRLHDLIKNDFGYEMTLARPAHYVDAIPDGFTSYDAYAGMGYTYMAADFDGAGWLPLSSYKDEVDAMITPMSRLLAEDPDALCGQIIFQKDGFNMSRRTPVADGLPLQLELLSRYGYKVLTVPELLGVSPFSDVCEDHPVSPAARKLIDSGLCAAYRDNTIRPDAVCSRGEFYMMLHGLKTTLERVDARAPMAKKEHPYSGAACYAKARETSREGLDRPIDGAELNAYCLELFGLSPKLSGASQPRGEVITALASIINDK